MSVILFIATRWGILRSPDAFVRSVQFLPILCALVVGLNVVFIVYNVRWAAVATATRVSLTLGWGRVTL